MSVQSYGQTNDGRGHEKSMAAFKRSHEENTNALLNLAEGKSEEEPRPAYDPNHTDNHWPIMVHHAAKGELVVGKSLRGIKDPAERRQVTDTNKAAKKAALDGGYRCEPYLKPQIAVMDPAAEKAAMKAENAELRGQINALNDMMARVLAGIEAKQAS